MMIPEEHDVRRIKRNIGQVFIIVVAIKCVFPSSLSFGTNNATLGACTRGINGLLLYIVASILSPYMGNEKSYSLAGSTSAGTDCRSSIFAKRMSDLGWQHFAMPFLINPGKNAKICECTFITHTTHFFHRSKNRYVRKTIQHNTTYCYNRACLHPFSRLFLRVCPIFLPVCPIFLPVWYPW